MAIEMYRIDDRLIHGQVVVGWGQPLDLQFIVLVDEEVASSDWEQELYRMGVPPEMDVYFESIDSAASLGGAGDIGRDPVRVRQTEIVIEDVIADRLERPGLFLIRENQDSEVLLRHQQRQAHHPCQAARVGDDLAALIIAQAPPQPIGGETWFGGL